MLKHKKGYKLHNRHKIMKKAIISVFMLVFLIGLVSANAPTPSGFYGNILDSKGDDILNGYITAKLNGVISGVAEVQNGEYLIKVLAYNQIGGTIKFYYGDEKIGEHDFIDMGVTNLDFIVDSVGSENPVDGFCDVPADECRYNALDCNPDKTDACLGNGRCDTEIGETCSNSELDCGACVVDNPNTGGNTNTGGNNNNNNNDGGGGNTPSTTTPSTTSDNNDGGDTTQTSDEDDSGLGFLETTTEIKPNVFSRITGAVTGTLGVVGSWIIVVFILGVIGSAITVRMIRKKNVVSE